MKKMMMCALAIVFLLVLAGCGEEVESVAVDTATASTEYVSEESMMEDVVTQVPEETLAHDETTSQDVITAQLCYEQLNDIEKEIYVNLMVSTELFVENEDVLCYSYSAERGYDSSVIEYARNAVQAFLKDHPVATMWIGAYNFKTGITEVYEDGEYSHLASIELYMTPPEETGRYAETADSDTLNEFISEFEYQADIFVAIFTSAEEE
ncbi:MAG: hypothetical protein IJ274_12675 [Lachnospiraceae bacterium]|nr:hypothetical protein [Lachnospiraceae bacterium]